MIQDHDSGLRAGGLRADPEPGRHGGAPIPTVDGLAGGRRARVDAARRSRRSRRRFALALAAIGVVSFAVRVWAPGPVTQTTDETLWLRRADAFRTALADFDLRHATAAHHVPGVENDTMPGVTTMWAATIGRGVADVTGRIGLTERLTGSSYAEPTVLRFSRAVVALWCSLAIALFAYLATRLVGRPAGLVTGTLLASEPWFAGLSNLLHTDAMVAIFSACSLAALAVALGLGPPRTAGRHAAAPVRWPAARAHGGWLVTSAALAGLAALTKVNALALVAPGAVVVVLTALWHAWRGASLPSIGRATRRTLAVTGIWLGAGILLFFALWPAMWVTPVDQFANIGDALEQIGSGHLQFFLGEVTTQPSSLFYPVTFVFRITPWMLLGALVVVVVIVIRSVGTAIGTPRLERLLPAMPTWPIVTCLPYLALITWSAKKLDRYAVPVLPMLALLIGVIVVVAARSVVERTAWPGALVPAGLVAAALAVAHCFAQAPYAVAYVDPLLGQARASRTMMLGWGEGRERLGTELADRERGRCDDIDVVGYDLGPITFPCGLLRSPSPGHDDVADADYAVTYIGNHQRERERELRMGLRRAHATVIKETKIGGTVYAQLWQIPQSP